ncbi:SapC family protein [Simiduia sp. 21SJ11W-1]|uniref:SapC family protein n=1 Tax=Simiduia sp. 21SJ11W-1 TaxID=2909669 RepID=UPI00209FF038|nr:SapC family protein [Simiduia sp. 21SJ11W-1]UTA48359.1 SapC family protein [Simiduia sp. 21SJ11W-1]
MANAVLLNNQEHHQLKYQPTFGEPFGHSVGRMVVFPNEIKNLHVQYPLLFAKGQDGLQLVALLGFGPEENLFLEGADWNAHVTPLLAARGPFSIGYQTAANGTQAMVVHADLADARLSDAEGEALFLPEGGAAPRLQRVQGLLAAIDEGIKQTAPFVKLLEQHQLLEPLSLDVSLGEQSYRLEGYYSISGKALENVSAEALQALHKSGALALIYWLVGSMANVSRLAHLKQRQLQHAS